MGRQMYKVILSLRNRYSALSAAYLSYANWSCQRILKALQVQNSKKKTISILGSRDKRLSAEWPEQQRKTGIEVGLVKGTNHFFGGEYQFDLLNVLEEILGL